MNEEDPRIRRYKIAKRILVLMILYIIVVLKTPESRAALPGLSDCLLFYCRVIQALAGVQAS
ncbi:MAG: hypothetical protein J5722_02900 [Oscillospiraceae bacterium]|nr:hypothetical protein [Oscillospiraceae bacterium]